MPVGGNLVKGQDRGYPPSVAHDTAFHTGVTRPAVPGPPFRLTANQRAQLRQDIDRDAAETLLGRLTEPARSRIWDLLRDDPHPELEKGGGGRPAALPPSVTDIVLTDSGDGSLWQRIIAPVGTADPERRRALDGYLEQEAPVRREPVLVIIPSVWRDARIAAVVRRAPATPGGDVIALPASPSAEAFDQALHLLYADRRASRTQVPREFVVGPVTPRPLSAAWRARLETVMAQLQRSVERPVPHFGLARVLHFKDA